MIEHKTVAVEHLAEVSPDELADIVREGRVLRMSCASCVPNIEGACAACTATCRVGLLAGTALVKPCSHHRQHWPGDAKGPARCSTVQVDDASGRVEVKHETYATWSHRAEGTQNTQRSWSTKHHHPQERDPLLPHHLYRSRVPVLPGGPHCCTRRPRGFRLVVVVATSSFRPAFSLFTFVSPGRYIEYLAKGNISSLMKEDIVKGNRMEERIDTELVQRGDKLQGAGEMDEAMITGRINTRLVFKGVDDIVIRAAPWYMVFEAKIIGSEDAQLSKAPIQQVQAGGALCVRHRAAVGVWVAPLTSGAADTLAVLDKMRTLTVGSPKVMCARARR
ncbi:hypothetical protein PTSG_02675 [Salpingoeca rosetta]|uniref:Uncharacterized protein n=1 Tax=Salpingoeca rosetta (strain ATCC 50818 / BSB-021) TaxID=946362 RepID=F2U2Z4_SALR5|nr:uncharacterized protein PTSG_02675 [Salpingoeca rosetta]EGD81988.1 hypothetical protein PTSG_02675 [Salpingoeca rosetta]|eukprot:XP_004996171.1 hypothetical protein PTSG_02675 [Salpingoeca rosetta]